MTPSYGDHSTQTPDAHETATLRSHTEEFIQNIWSMLTPPMPRAPTSAQSIYSTSISRSTCGSCPVVCIHGGENQVSSVDLKVPPPINVNSACTACRYCEQNVICWSTSQACTSVCRVYRRSYRMSLRESRFLRLCITATASVGINYVTVNMII